MLGIKIRNRFLSLDPGTQLTVEMEHPMDIIVEGQDILKGGFTAPILVPLDEVNLTVFGHAIRPDSSGTFITDEYCELWVDGVLLYTGLATVQEATHTHASLYMVFNETTPLKDTALSEVDLGGIREIGEDSTTRLAHAKDTAENPLDHDYVFCPVLNPVYGIDPTGTYTSVVGSHMVNRWDYEDEAFSETLTGQAMPFIRLDYLLRRIFLHLGYTIDNQWQDTDELKLLLLYNNRSIYATNDEWATTINLRDHVPYRSCMDLIKAVVSTFALSIFHDTQSKTITLIPMASIIRSAVHMNITHLIEHGYTISQDLKYISRLRYGIDVDDALSVLYSGVTFPLNLLGLGLTIYDLAGSFIGKAYIQSDNTYYQIGDSTLPDINVSYLSQDHKEIKHGTTDLEYISPLIPLWSSWDLNRDGWIYSATESEPDLDIQEMLVPHIQAHGYSLPYTWMRSPQVAFRTMLYRGMQPYNEGITGEYPMAGVTRYNIRGDVVGDHSLLWDVPGGVYETWWAPVYEMMAAKKTLRRRLRLDIAFLLQFRFYQKYRIENQNVFFTHIRFTVSDRGISPAEVTMITAP